MGRGAAERPLLEVPQLPGPPNPSSLSLKCLRTSALERTGREEEVKPDRERRKNDYEERICRASHEEQKCYELNMQILRP